MKTRKAVQVASEIAQTQKKILSIQCYLGMEGDLFKKEVETLNSTVKILGAISSKIQKEISDL